MIATQPKSRQILGINQQAYQSLRASMSLNLRRQLLIAVCDNVVLQNQLASQLEQDLAEKSWLATQARGSSSSLALTSSGTPLSISLRLERLVFDSEDAHLPRQVAHWVRQATLSGSTILPQVQMLGIEQMTRQPAIIQNHFLRSLEQIEALLPRLNTSLLVWVPWPWLRTIQSSSPNFWKWRNGVFEFVSDPTPTVQSSPSSSELDYSLDANRFAEEISRLEQGARENSRIDNRTDRQPTVANGNTSGSTSADTREKARQDANTTTHTDAETDDYPTIDTTHQVVALYGETDDGEFGDYDQPELETVAIWDTVDVDATPIYSSSEETEPTPSEHTDSSNTDSSTTDLATTGASSTDPFSEESLVIQLGHLRSNRPDTASGEQTQTIDTAQASTEPAPTEQAAEQQLPAAQRQSIDSAIAIGSNAQRQNAADDYFEIGRNYRSRIEAGERGLTTIEPAIAAYEGGLRCLSGPHPEWGSGLNDLGTLYWLKAQQLNDTQQIVDCMNHSVELYAEALTKIDPERDYDMACQLYSNMGAVHSMLATILEPTYHFKQAANAYTQALPLCSLTETPNEYATLHNSLGSVHWKLSHYEQDPARVQENLSKAIAAYRQALLGYTTEERPLDYAAVQNNLGITYWSLAKYIEPDTDAVTTLKNAIAAYRDALSYRTPESDPAACAITYNNLALAYWDLAKSEAVEPEAKLRYQRNAVTAFEAALQTSSAVGSLSQMDRAAIYHCLGDVHAQMVDNALSLEEVANSLQKSLYSYVQAIEGMPTASPVYEARLKAIIANLQSHHQHLGLASQQAALNRVPSELISEVMQAL